MQEDLYNANGEYVKTVEWAEIQPTSDAPMTFTIDGAWAEESITVTQMSGGRVSLGIVTMDADDQIVSPLLTLDYDARQALIRALQAL